MGLDEDLLLEECEAKFGIRISDASEVRTAGDLTDLVIRVLRQDGKLPSAQSCFGANHFYSLRRSLVSVGISRSLILPSATLGELLDSPRLVQKANLALHAHLGPVTVRSKRSKRTRAFVHAALCIGGGLWAMSASLQSGAAVFGAALLAVLVASLIHFVILYLTHGSRRVGSELVQPSSTIRELITKLVDNDLKFSDDSDEQMIWNQVRMIILGQQTVDFDKVVPSAKFGEDIELWWT
jgi:hypothetical protein